MSRVFPAHAGVILASEEAKATKGGFPRTRGGDPYEWMGISEDKMFSPHTRG